MQIPGNIEQPQFEAEARQMQIHPLIPDHMKKDRTKPNS